jgi:hypothetical protein
MLPISTEATIATGTMPPSSSRPSSIAENSSAEATSAEAAPPKPLSRATICGIAVIWMRVASTTPRPAPTMIPALTTV